MKLGRFMLLAALALASSAPTILAQETRSTIGGIVQDPTGAVIAGASVVVTNSETNVSVSLTSNDSGRYEANLLLPGVYRIEAKAVGFKTNVRDGVTLQTSTRLQLNLSLTVGSQAESITVTGETSALETDAATSGRVLDNRSIMDLPVMGNSAMLLVKYAPGVQSSGVNNYMALHSNLGASDYSTGGAVGGNEWSIDGVSNNGNRRRAAYLPYSDTLQEFKVETSNFDASVGHTTGVSVQMISKSGTNQLHGTLTEQHWQQRWNGTPFFTKQNYYRRIAAAEAGGNSSLANQLRNEPKQSSGRSNNWGASVGGPVVIPGLYNGKDKLFFFFSYNGFKDSKSEEPNNVNITVPTMANREGDFSSLLNLPNASRFIIYDPLTVRTDPDKRANFVRTPFPGNIIPKSRIVNPTYNAYLKLIPSPNNDPGNTALEPVNNYLASQTPFNWDYKAFAHRMDYQASSTHRFFGRWSWNDFLQDRTDWTYETARGLHSDGLNRRNRGATVDYVWTKSAATMFDFAVSANEFSDGNSRPVATSYKPSQVGLPSYLDTFAGDRTMLPYIDFNGYRDIGDVDGGNDGYPSGNRYRVVNGKVDVFHLRGSHTIRAGVDARGQYLSGAGSPYTSGRFQFTNTYTRKYDTTIEPAADLGHSWASFMLGLPSSATVDRQDSYIMLTPYYGWYVQDNWRVTNTVNLSFGLRMEYELGSTERYNRSVSYFDPTLKLPITDAAQAAYAMRPIAELPVSQFSVFGGSVYPGQNGAPRKLNQNEFMFLPRLGIAWQFRPTTVIRAGYGLYFDSWNVMNFNSVDQLGYSRSTGTNFTNDAGVTWLAGDPYNGISPMSDPFPMRSDGTRFNEPVQNGLGSMAKVGGGWDPYTPYDLQRARQQRWRGSVQQEFLNNVVEVAYAGSYSDRNYINQRLNPLAEQYFAKGTVRDTSAQTAMDANVPNPFLLSNFAGLQQTNPVLYQDMSTKGFYTNTNIRRNQLLRAFPQMSGTLSKLSNLGEFKSHALETRFDRRMAKGLLINASYVWSSFRSADFFYNEFDAEPTWRESNNGRPHRFVASGIYEFPLGKGRTFLTEGFFSHLLGGFQTGATYEWQPGALLDFGNVFFYGDLEDIALSGGDRTLDRWFNIDAGFERNAAKVPASYQLRTFPTRVDGVRADSTNVWNINLQRNFVVRERLNVQFRVDALNALNRSQFAGPSTDPLSTNFGRVTSQTSATNRFLQMQLRIRF